MKNYKKMYLLMFGETTKAIACIQQNEIARAWQILVEAQQACEEMFMDLDE